MSPNAVKDVYGLYTSAGEERKNRTANERRENRTRRPAVAGRFFI